MNHETCGKKGLESRMGCLEADPPPDEPDRKHQEDETDPRTIGY